MINQVTAAVIIRNGRVLVMRRAAHEKLAGKWEFPGGKVEPGESDEACLERELMEELGIRGHTGMHLCDNPYRYAFGEILLKAYVFEYPEGDFTLRVHDDMMWAGPDDLMRIDFSPADVPVAEYLVKHLRELQLPDS